MINTQVQTQLKIEVGARVYFEDESYQGKGVVHYLPTEDEQNFQNEVHGENAISVKPKNGKARFVPISQIVIL